DAITREPGGFAAALNGIRALAAAGVRVEITAPVVRRNLGLLPALPREIIANNVPATALVLVIPTTAPNSEECASLTDIASTILAVSEQARTVGLALRIDPTTYVPPCIFEKPERVTHLYALNRGNALRPGFERVPNCEACLVNE